MMSAITPRIRFTTFILILSFYVMKKRALAIRIVSEHWFFYKDEGSL